MPVTEALAVIGLPWGPLAVTVTRALIVALHCPRCDGRCVVTVTVTVTVAMAEIADSCSVSGRALAVMVALA